MSVGSTLADAKHTAEISAVGFTVCGLVVCLLLYVINKGKILSIMFIGVTMDWALMRCMTLFLLNPSWASQRH